MPDYNYVKIAEWARRSANGVTRAEVAQKFAIGKGTAKSHLENAVQKGWLAKAYTHTDDSHHGWVYFDPNQKPPLEL